MLSTDSRVVCGEAYANGVGAVVENNGRRRRFALHDGAGVQFHFLRSEAGSRGDRRIHL